MTTNNARPTNLGLLSKLPPELREKIYRHLLVLPEPIRITPYVMQPFRSAPHPADVNSSPSPLALLATSKGSLSYFIILCPNRYRFMEEISFRYAEFFFDTCPALMDCQRLRILHIHFHHLFTKLGENSSLVSAKGIESLRKLRGIEILDLWGKDRIDIGEGHFRKVDVNDPRALGPILRSELMRPRE